jgi:hypothetical protein
MSRPRTSRRPQPRGGNDREKDKEAREQDVDEAVEMTFPASDAATPGHATSTEPPARPTDRKAPVINKDDIEAAAKGTGDTREAPRRRGQIACPDCGALGKVGDGTCPRCGGVGAIADDARRS